MKISIPALGFKKDDKKVSGKHSGILFILTLILGLASPCQLRAAEVTNNSDEGAGSLRQAVADAEAGEIITFADSFTMTLASPIVIDKDIEIDGGNSVTISGGGATSIFKITSGNVVIKNITLKNGLSQGGRGGGPSRFRNYAAGGGGAGFGGAIAIRNGDVEVEGVTFVGNKALGGEGGNTSALENQLYYDANYNGGQGAWLPRDSSGYGGASLFGNGGGRQTEWDSKGKNGGLGGGGGGGRGPYSSGPLGGGNGGFGGGGGGGASGPANPNINNLGAWEGNGGVGGTFAGSGGKGDNAVQFRGGGGGGGGAGLGGAIYIHDGEITIKDSVFEDNEAQGGSGGAGGNRGSDGQGVGGAIFVYENAEISIESVTFINNSSTLSDSFPDDIYLHKKPDEDFDSNQAFEVFSVETGFTTNEEVELSLGNADNLMVQQSAANNGVLTGVIFESGTNGKIYFDRATIGSSSFVRLVDFDNLVFYSPPHFPSVHPSTDYSVWNYASVYRRTHPQGFVYHYPIAQNSLKIAVNSTNDLPTLGNASVSMNEDTVVGLSAGKFNSAYNDYDSNHTISKIIISSLPENGLLKLNETPVVIGQQLPIQSVDQGLFTFTPVADYPSPASSGTVSFDFFIENSNAERTDTKTFSITVRDTADPPVIFDDAAVATGGVPVLIDVLENDTDPLGPLSPPANPLSYSISIIGQPERGTVSVEDQKIRYVPDNEAGQVTILYKISNGTDSNVATLTIDVSYNRFLGSIIVDIEADEDDGITAPGGTSLREAIEAVGQDGVTKVIFAENLNGTQFTVSEPLLIDKDIEIDGGNSVTISGGGATSIFKITSGNVVIKNITLKNGLSQGGRGGGPSRFRNYAAGGGGAGFGGAIAIRNGDVEVEGVTFVGNKALGGEGGNTSALENQLYYDANYNGGQGAWLPRDSSGYGGASLFGNGGGRQTEWDSKGKNGGLGGGGGGGRGPYSSGPLGGGNGGFGGGGGGGASGPANPNINNLGAWEGNGGVGGTFAGSGGKGDNAVQFRGGGGGGGGAGLGGAIYIHDGKITIKDSVFKDNEAQGGSGGAGGNTGSDGQGVGGAIFVYENAALNVRGQLTYDGNSAQTSDANYYIMEGAEYDSAPPVVAGTFTGEVTEGNEGDISSVTGTISITDADADDNPSFEDVDLNGNHGTLVLAGGTWTYTLDQVAAQDFQQGDLREEKITLSATDGTQQLITITINGANDAPVGVVATAGATEDGDTLTGQLSSTDADVAVFATNTYSVVLNDGEELNVFADNDGSHSWLLVGRGREGWEFDADGQGALADIGNSATLGTSAAFSPAMYPDALINEFISRSGVALTDIEIRLKRAGDPAGTTYQEMRWRPKTQTVWRSNFDVAYDVEKEIVAVGGATGDRIYLQPNSDTRVQYIGNDATRVFTWSWPGHNNLKGFSYGNLVSNGVDNSTSFLWEYSDQNHAIPYTEVYIRRKDSNQSLLEKLVKPETFEQPAYLITKGVAGLVIAQDGSYTFDPSHSNYQSLAEGETQELVAEWTVTDANGGSSASTLTITVTGTNDAPVSVAANGEVVEDGDLLSGQLSVTDPDSNSTYTYALAEPVAGLTLNPDGSYSFDASGDDYQSIPSGQVRDVVASWVATGANGDEAVGSLTLKITGANLSVTPATANAIEGGVIVNGQLVATDDNGAALSYSLDGTVAGLTINSDGSYQFDPRVSAYDSLAKGGQQEIEAQWNVSDPALNDSLASTLKITLTGTNDAPVATAVTQIGGFKAFDLTWESGGGDIITGTISFPADSLANPPAIPSSSTPLAGGVFSVTLDGITKTHDNPRIIFTATQALDYSSDLVGQAGFTDFNVFSDDRIEAFDYFTIKANGQSYVLGSMKMRSASIVTAQLVANDVDLDPQIVRRFALTWESGDSDIITGTISFPADSLANPPAIPSSSTPLAGGVFSVTLDGITKTHDNPRIIFTATQALDYSSDLVGQAGFTDFNVFSDDRIEAFDYFTIKANGQSYALVSMKALSNLKFSLDMEVPGLSLTESGAYSFDPSNLSYQFLPTGETLEVVAPWTVEDEHGASDSSNLTITVTGTSDAPLTKGAVNGDGDTLTGELENPGNATGFALMEPVAGLTINGDGGYSFDPSAGSFDGLKAGQTSQVIANWKAFDENSVEINGAVLITVTGVNDAPVAVAAAAAVTEDDALFSGQLVAPDPDQDAVVTFALAGEEAIAGLTINEDGGFFFDSANTAYQDVAQGADRVVVANWVATDELGAAGAGTLTITVTGVNDGPVAVTNSINVTEGGDPLPGALVANDLDQGAVVTYALADNVAGLSVSEDGSFTFDPANAAYQALAQGESQEVVANWVATDDQGAKANGALTITVAGSNNSPVTNPFEGAAAAGQLIASDSDNGSSLVYSLNEVVEGLTINADGSYGFDLTLPAYRSLRAGETLVVEAGWTATDNNEASTSSTLKLTLEGVNDTPEPVPATAAANEDSLAVVTGQLSATDADANAVLTYALDAPVAGLTINEEGAFSFELPSGSNQSLALGQTSEIVANWTVTDDAEATANGTLTITVNGANDAPVGVDASVEVPKGFVVSGKTLVLDMYWGGGLVKATITLPDESEWRDGDIIDLMMPLNRENFKLSSPQFSLELEAYLENQLDIFGDFRMRGFVPFLEFGNEIRIGELERFDLFVSGDLDLFIFQGGGDISYRNPEIRDLFDDSGFFIFDSSVFVDDRARLEDATSSITSGSLAATDVDQNSVLIFALDEPVAGLTFATNGDYTFDGNNQAYADLWEGDSREVVADWTVTDQHGATDSQKLTITVKGNGVNPAPVITVTSGTDTVEQGSTWTDAGATADGGETVTVSGTVDTNTVGTHTITYTATDAAGNIGTATRTVTVVETTADPYDTWASSFGLDPATDGAPTADPDGDGQNNLFEFTAGVVPNDALSRFHWRVEEDPDTPGQNRIVFSPRFGDRTYNVETSTTLQASDWIDFTGGSVNDDGDERTVIDPDTSDARKFYRLKIVKP